MYNEELLNNIGKERYFRDGETTWDEVFERVAKFMTENDEEYKRLFNLMSTKTFLFNSPTLMNAGTDHPMLSACVALGIDDDMESILKTMTNCAIMLKWGCGVGVDFSPLRPSGALVESTQGNSSGVISFMELYNQYVETVRSGGKRRGASLSALNVQHPDIFKFVKCKETDNTLSNMNISVRITDSFMNAVENNLDWDLRFDGKVYETVKAKDLFDLITYNAWLNGEPGVLFVDTILKTEPNDGYPISCNACSESCLKTVVGGGELCNLGSINITKYFNTNFGSNINWNELESDVRFCIKMLDRIVDKNFYPIPEIEMMTKQYRRLGLGIMGLHDLFILNGISYDSVNARNLASSILEFITKTSHDELPNTHALTISAPTGTLATIAGCSYGVEPHYSLCHTRKTWVSGEPIEYTITIPIVGKYLKDHGYTQTQIDDVVLYVKKHGTIIGCNIIKPEYQNVLKTALDISPLDHVKMQCELQKYIDNSISKTINLPNNATVEDVREVFMYAWKHGAKGLTVYRDGSRETQVLTTQIENVEETFDDKFPEDRPKVLFGATYEMHSGCGKIFVTTSEYNGKPFEVFVHTDGAGGCEANVNALGRLLSLNLRNGVSVKQIVKQLSRVVCPRCKNNGKQVDGKSCADIIGKCLLQGLDEITESKTQNTIIKNKCPECNGELLKSEGCIVCPNCGFSRC